MSCHEMRIQNLQCWCHKGPPTQPIRVCRYVQLVRLDIPSTTVALLHREGCGCRALVQTLGNENLCIIMYLQVHTPHVSGAASKNGLGHHVNEEHALSSKAVLRLPSTVKNCVMQAAQTVMSHTVQFRKLRQGQRDCHVKSSAGAAALRISRCTAGSVAGAATAV